MIIKVTTKLPTNTTGTNMDCKALGLSITSAYHTPCKPSKAVIHTTPVAFCLTTLLMAAGQLVKVLRITKFNNSRKHGIMEVSFDSNDNSTINFHETYPSHIRNHS